MPLQGRAHDVTTSGDRPSFDPSLYSGASSIVPSNGYIAVHGGGAWVSRFGLATVPVLLALTFQVGNHTKPTSESLILDYGAIPPAAHVAARRTVSFAEARAKSRAIAAAAEARRVAVREREAALLAPVFDDLSEG